MRGVAVLGDDERDLLSLESHLVRGQHRDDVVREGRDPRQVQRLQQGAGDHGLDLRMRFRGRGVDRHDPRVCVRAAQHGPVQHAGQLDVVDIGAAAAEETRVLLADLRPKPTVVSSRDSVVVMTTPPRSPARQTADGWRPTGSPARCSRSRCSGTAARRLPRGSRRVGTGWCPAGARAVIIMPGVQKPHCSPCSVMKPCWTGSSSPARSIPSTVRTACRSAIAASTVQLFTGTPSMVTTQTPQLEVSQPQWVPVRPQVVAEEMHQQQPGLDLAGDRVAVDGHLTCMAHASCPRQRAIALRSTRRVSSPAAPACNRPGRAGRSWLALGCGLSARQGDRLVVGWSAPDGVLGGGGHGWAAPMAARPMPTSEIVSPSSHTAAPAEAIGQSPARRSTLA